MYGDVEVGLQLDIIPPWLQEVGGELVVVYRPKEHPNLPGLQGAQV